MSEPAGRRSRGEIFEGVAFSLCKAATLILLTRDFALPVAAGGAAIFYILADLNGKKDTRCLLMKPKVIALFWGLVALGALWWKYKG